MAMRKPIILLWLAFAATTLQAQHQYRFWFDSLAESPVAGTVSGSTHLDLDVTGLTDGLHQLFVAVTEEEGTIVDQQSRIFVKTATEETLRYSYWFDDDSENVKSGIVETNKHLMLNVRDLPVGLHTLHIILSDMSNVIISQQSALFVKVPGGGILRYEYYVNDWETLVGGETFTRAQDPFLLMTELDVSGVTPKPLRSDNFYFCIDDGEPIVMAKNDIYFRFYGEDYSYVEEAAQYADLSTSETVVAEQLEEKKIKRSAIPASEAISWFKADAEAGDSVLFSVSIPATMQLFAPDGTEVAKAGSREIRLRTTESGTYYLAVYDAGSNVPSQINVYYEQIEDVQTGISHSTVSATTGSTPVYDLNGWRVPSSTHKSIIIVGNRKVVRTAK